MGRIVAVAMVMLLVSCDMGHKSGSDASAASAQGSGDVAKLRVVLKRGALGEQTTEGVADLFSAERQQGFNTVESADPVVQGLQDGMITFKGKPMPAGVMKAQYVMRNDKGDKHQLCIFIVGAHDDEPSMWHNVQATRCESPTAGRDIGRWKRHNAFVPQTTLGDAIPDDPGD